MKPHRPKISTRERIESIIYSSPVEITVYVLIVLSVAMIAIEIGFPEWTVQHGTLFDDAEDFFIVFFAIEYFSKLLLSKNKWVFFKQHIIDLLAILPFIRFVGLFRGLRILRILRVVRLARLGNIILRQINDIDGMHNIREIVIILMVFICTVLAGTTGITMFERNYPDTDFHTIGDGLWWCIVTITTVGYGDLSPKSSEGRMLGGAIMLVGLSFYGLVAGLGSNFIINHLKKSSEWIISTFRDHIVIIGMNDKTAVIVEKLMALNRRVVLLTDDQQKAPHHPENKLVIIEGNTTDQHQLQRTGISSAKYAIVLIDDQYTDSRLPEMQSVLSTLAIKKHNPKINIITEAFSSDGAFHLKKAGSKTIIQDQNFTSDILANSIAHTNYVKSTQSLIRRLAHTHIYTEPVKEEQIGHSLRSLQREFLKKHIVLLGMTHHTETIRDGNAIAQAEFRLIMANLKHEPPDE